MLVDTHAHLFFEDFKDDLDQVIARAKEAGVTKIIVPGTSVETSQQAVELAKKYPGVIYAAAGVHPEEVLDHSLQVSPGLAGARLNISAISRDLLSGRDLEGVVAVGEIGMDGYSAEMQKCMNEQGGLFKAQCEIALEYDLPVIIHTRNSFAEVWEVLSGLPQMPQGQFHCFSVDPEALEKVLAAGFYASFCGNITWSKRVAKLVPLVPLDRLLLETDSPFMKPGERNEPANVRITAQIIADLRGVTLKDLGEQTTENVGRLYKI